MLSPPVLILCDESNKYTKKIVGAISITLKDFYELEDYITRYRTENLLFGEIKWEKVKKKGKNFDCYSHLISYALNIDSLRFHSNEYTGDQHKANYALLRSISWKLENCGFDGEVGVLIDKIKKEEVELTKDILNYDSKFKHNVKFCVETDSKIFNTMQITDLLCGCIAYKINVINKKKGVINPCKKEFAEVIEAHDQGLPLEFSSRALWGYNSKKIQHYCLN